MAHAKIRARYVSNAGLVLEVNDTRIGIDLFCRDPLGIYPDTPKEIWEELLQEIAEGRLHTLIFTHDHGDHFSAEMVREVWACNPKLRVLSTEAAVLALAEAGLPQGVRMTALRVRDLPEGIWAIPDGKKEQTIRWVEIDGIEIGFLNTVHEGAAYEKVQNLTLFIRAGERYLVIPGDAAPGEGLFEKIASWQPVLDCFFLPFPYVGIRSTRNMLVRNLKIHSAFVLHQPKPEADAQNWVKNAIRMCGRAEDGLVMPYFPERLGEWWTVPKE